MISYWISKFLKRSTWSLFAYVSISQHMLSMKLFLSWWHFFFISLLNVAYSFIDCIRMLLFSFLRWISFQVSSIIQAFQHLSVQPHCSFLYGPVIWYLKWFQIVFGSPSVELTVGSFRSSFLCCPSVLSFLKVQDVLVVFYLRNSIFRRFVIIMSLTGIMWRY
jgi:hypothetical protein